MSIPVYLSSCPLKHTYHHTYLCVPHDVCAGGVWHSRIWTEKPFWFSFLAFQHISFRVHSLIPKPLGLAFVWLHKNSLWQQVEIDSCNRHFQVLPEGSELAGLGYTLGICILKISPGDPDALFEKQAEKWKNTHREVHWKYLFSISPDQRLLKSNLFDQTYLNRDTLSR